MTQYNRTYKFLFYKLKEDILKRESCQSNHEKWSLWKIVHILPLYCHANAYRANIDPNPHQITSSKTHKLWAKTTCQKCFKKNPNFISLSSENEDFFFSNRSTCSKWISNYERIFLSQSTFRLIPLQVGIILCGRKLCLQILIRCIQESRFVPSISSKLEELFY